MKNFLSILLFFGFQIIYSQHDTLNVGFKKNFISGNLSTAFGENFRENAVQISYYRRIKVEPKIHFEYGLNFYYSKDKNPLKYIKNDSIYQTQTAGIAFDFGIKMVKEFRLKNVDFEWTNNLSLGAITFDQNDIPKDEHHNYNTNENGKTIHVDLNMGTLATINYGQSLRVFRKNFGVEISANYFPVSWIEKKHLIENLQVFRFGVGTVYRF